MNANAAVLLFLAIDLAIAGVVTYALGVNAKSEGGLKKSGWWGIRTTATMANEEVFTYTNKLAVKAYRITSVLSFVVSACLFILAACLFILAIISIFVEAVWVICAGIVCIYSVLVVSVAIRQGFLSHRAAKEFLRNADVKGDIPSEKEANGV